LGNRVDGLTKPSLATILGIPGWWCDGGDGALFSKVVVAPGLACTTVGVTGFDATTGGFTATLRLPEPVWPESELRDAA
jgi:hypothetical protein